MVSLVFLLPFFAFLIWNTSRLGTSASFADYKDKLGVSVVDEKPSANGKTELITVRLENRTNKTWKRPKFQIESLNADDKVLTVEHMNEYNLVVTPNSSALDTMSLRIIPAESVVKHRVTLTEIDSNRY
jgi:hypothetical protein